MYRKCNSCGVEAHSEKDMQALKFICSEDSMYGYRNQCYNCKTTDNSTASIKYSKLAHQAKKRYDCTAQEYTERMLTSNVCEICGKTAEETKDSLCYDHDHSTMEFRGVLCRGCNRSLGQLGDNLEGIIKVVKYLEKHNDTH
mgnify:FL=1